MSKFDSLETTKLDADSTFLHPTHLPEVVHMDDPALDVMIDFKQIRPATIGPNEPIDDALNEMKLKGVHLLLVTNRNQNVLGLISTEDILGEIPILLTTQKRIPRADILVKMVMIPQKDIIALDIETLRNVKVGNIVNTLQTNNSHYALVVRQNEQEKTQFVRGLFSSSQISKQLHMAITNSITEADSVAELRERLPKD